MADINSTIDAWQLIWKATMSGTFVPVLGPELATDPTFTQAPHLVLDSYGQDDGLAASQQKRELDRISLRQARLGDLIRTRRAAPREGVVSEVTVAHWRRTELLGDSHDGGGPWRPTVEKLASYIENIRWSGVPPSEGPRDEAFLQSDVDRLLDDLFCDVAFLALRLKQAWHGVLTNDLTQMSALRPRQGVDDTNELDDQEIHYLLAACLEECRLLFEEWARDLSREPFGLQLKWVYCRLLLLGSELYGASPRSLWWEAPVPFRSAPLTFMANHAIAVRRLDLDDQCGWVMAEMPPRARGLGHGRERGLRLTHILWMETLCRHLLLAGTRVYRSSRELAFLLSLDNAVGDLPNMSGDPFEVGLLSPAEVDRDLVVIRGVFGFVENSVTPEGALVARSPGAFHQAIARLVREMLRKSGRAPTTGAGRRKKTSAAATSPVSQKALILTMALDTEMERALEQEFDAYRVLIPVYLPLKRARAFDATWLLGEYEVRTEAGLGRRVSQPIRWTRVTEMNEDLRVRSGVAGSGPLLIKLFGSPLTDVGVSEDYSASGGDVDTKRDILPRMVLDERELLRLLKESIPLEVRDLGPKFGSSSLFFFGQNAVSWSDHVPYLIVDSLRSLRDSTVDRERREGSEFGSGESEAFVEGEGRAPFVALAERSEYGESLFNRLKIDRNVNQVTAGEVAQVIMKNVAIERVGREEDELA